MTQYLDVIISAIKCVTHDYFKVKTTYEPEGIPRERVFCYELYHQMRKRMTKSPLLIHGEIDKRGHEDFALEDRKNPDFVLHIPGTHEGNTVVVEVKGRLDCRLDELTGDIKKLLTFVRRYQYKLGVFLLFNHTFDELSDRLGVALERLSETQGADHVVLLCIKEAHGQCEVVQLNKTRGDHRALAPVANPQGG